MTNKINLFLIILLLPALSFSQEITRKDGKYYNSDNELYSGTVKEYYDNGELKAEIKVENGDLDGKS
ncbi:MAG: hypothetical protein ACLFNL_00625, partial [Bacteroidales bacterium]